jgi:hypothetical protein
MVRASGKMQDERPKLLVDVADEVENSERRISNTIQEHLAKLPDDRQTWIPDNFTGTARIIVDEWGKLEKSIGRDTFYEPVSLDEQMAVVRALNFCKVTTFEVLLHAEGRDSAHWPLLHMPARPCLCDYRSKWVI